VHQGPAVAAGSSVSGSAVLDTDCMTAAVGNCLASTVISQRVVYTFVLQQYYDCENVWTHPNLVHMCNLPNLAPLSSLSSKDRQERLLDIALITPSEHYNRIDFVGTVLL
jgi:hypothetical protein